MNYTNLGMTHDDLLNISQIIATLAGLVFLTFTFWFSQARVVERLKELLHNLKNKKEIKEIIYDILLLIIPISLVYSYIIPFGIHLVIESYSYANKISKMNLTELQNTTQLKKIYNEIDEFEVWFKRWCWITVILFGLVFTDAICCGIFYKKR